MRIKLSDLSIAIIHYYTNTLIIKETENYFISNSFGGKILVSKLSESILRNIIDLYDHDIDNVKKYYYGCYINNDNDNYGDIIEYITYLTSKEISYSLDDTQSNYSKRYNPVIDISEEELFYLKLKYPKLIKFNE